eukprot:c19475_g1_i2.p2 GENE.c19475_g1_i2~~c19475_g1_i2.p2  ORF type:complete len:103 (+),score=10.69 c19475_g1_i2:588-896(+)
MGQGMLVQASPGDMILWDSRTIHGGRVGSGNAFQGTTELCRLVLTVCMLPKAGTPERILKLRQQAVQEQITLTHWANEYHTHMVNRVGDPPNLTKAQWDLVC